MGRTSTFCPKLGEQICERVSHGESVLKISKDDKMPAEATIRRWATDPKISNEAFATRFARARQQGADHEFDRLEELEAEIKAGTLDAQAGRVIIDSIKWRLSKKLPQVYGDRAHLELGGSVEYKASNAMPEHLGARIDHVAATAVQQGQDEDTVH